LSPKKEKRLTSPKEGESFNRLRKEGKKESWISSGEFLGEGPSFLLIARGKGKKGRKRGIQDNASINNLPVKGEGEGKEKGSDGP